MNRFFLRLGIIGGGQLGRMIAIAAAKFGCDVIVLADSERSPASKVSFKTIVSDFKDVSVIEQFAKEVDSAVVEFENIPFEFVKKISSLVNTFPSAYVLKICQNRILEKEFARQIGGGVSVVQFRKVSSPNELRQAFTDLGSVACILKTIELGYDGNGQYTIFDEEDICKLEEKLDFSVPYVLETLLEIKREVSIVASRSQDGTVECFPIAENIHRNGILITSLVPANIDKNTTDIIVDFAHKAIEKLNVVGLLAIEFFILEGDAVFFNEMAPRPHNTCHWSLSACNISQFEQLVRVGIGLPIKKVELLSSCKTENILGNNILNWRDYVIDKDVTLYGKDEIRDRRKMGHINVKKTT